MSAEFYFGMEVFLNGLMAGVMYSLVALGFVLIFKASGIFNYAQGVMALFAALTLVGFQNGQIPFAHLINAIFGTDLHYFGWHMPALLAIAFTLLVMIAFAYIVEFLILKHLVNQEPIILFMATIGLAYFMEGLGDLMWGSDIKKLDVGSRRGVTSGLRKKQPFWAAKISTASILIRWISLRPFWRRFWSRDWWLSANIQRLAGHCERWQMIIRPPFLLVSACGRFG